MLRQPVHLLHRYKNVNWALMDQAMVSGASFVTSIVLARGLGLQGFGTFTLCWMVVLFVNSFQIALVISPMMSIGPKQRDLTHATYYGSVWFHQISLALISVLLVWAAVRATAGPFPQWGISHFALPLAAAVGAFQLKDFLRRYFFARSKAESAFWNDVIGYGSQVAVLSFAVWKWSPSISHVLWIIAATSLIAVLWGMSRVGDLSNDANAHLIVLKRHWRFSRWQVGSAGMLWLTGNFFVIVAGGVLGVAAAGAIRAAQTLTQATNVLLQAMENFVPTECSKRYAVGGNAALFSYIRKVLILGGATVLTFALIMSVTPSFWLGTVFGEQYATFGNVLRGYAILNVLMFATVPLQAILRTYEATQYIFLSYAAATAISLMSAHLLITKFGLTGVIVGVIFLQCSMILVNVLAVMKLARRR